MTDDRFPLYVLFREKKRMNKPLPFIIMIAGIMMIAGCSISQRAVDNAQKRIDGLKAQGVPDSVLSDAVKYLYGASYAKQKDERAKARKSLDSARILIARAEALCKDKSARIKSFSDSMTSVLANVKSKLTGLQEKKIDSALTVINAFIKKNWTYQIEDNFNKAVAMAPQLMINEERAKEVKAQLPGEWVCTDKTKSEADKAINAIEKKTFIFNKDGTAKLVETKKGQSAKNLKEDWEFQSTGTFDCLGDTVFVFVNRFACVRQKFEQLSEIGGKKNWIKKTEPAYDSVITDHSQDRWVPFEEMKQDFVRGVHR
jgi:hypothetical protein